MFKVVSESEKAKKFTHFFDIDLEPYMEKSKIMIDRIKKVEKKSKEEEELHRKLVEDNRKLYFSLLKNKLDNSKKQKKRILSTEEIILEKIEKEKYYFSLHINYLYILFTNIIKLYNQ